jgi:hypothetical protein
MKALPVLDSKAAGIDVGSDKLHVSIAGEVSKVFGTFAGDLARLRDWLARGARLPMSRLTKTLAPPDAAPTELGPMV